METREQLTPAADSALNPVPADIAAPAGVVTETTDGPAADVKEETVAVKSDEYPDIDAVVNALALLAQREPAEIGRDDVSRLKGRFYALRKADVDRALTEHLEAGGDPAAFITVADPREQQLKDLLETIRVKKADYARAIEAEQEANAAAKEELIARLRAMAEDTDNVNRLFPEFRELQDKFKSIGDVPPTRTTELWKQYQEAVEHFYDMLKINKDLRDYDFRKNLESKTLICEETERLADADDIVVAFRRMQDLQVKWRETGPVAKEERDAIWTRFREASAVIYKKYQQFFEERKSRELENEAAKTALCERIEALDFSDIHSFSAWDEMTRHILAAQEEWKQLGFASRKANNALFTRFRATCDRFFAAKSEYYNNVKAEAAANLAAKTALCERAEALAGTTGNWNTATEAVRALREEWKTIGAVPRKHSDQVWQRFLKAIDLFFDRRKAATGSVRTTERENLRAKYAIVDELREFAATDPSRDEIVNRVRDAQQRWQQIGHVPYKDKDKVYADFRAIVDDMFQRRDAEGRRDRAARFEDRLNDLGEQGKLDRERERLCRILEQQRAEIKTCENNLGFFSSKSKSGDSMLRDIERRIERLRRDLEATEEKIRLIDAR